MLAWRIEPGVRIAERGNPHENLGDDPDAESPQKINTSGQCSIFHKVWVKRIDGHFNSVETKTGEGS